MSEIFFSYAAKDRDAAAAVIAAVSRAGFNVWHPELLAMGGSYAGQLAAKLDAAPCIIVLWSAAAAQSSSVQEEIHRTIKAWSSNRLVLAVLDDTPLPVGLRNLQAIDLRDAGSTGTKTLIDRIRPIVEPPMSAPAEPPSAAAAPASPPRAAPAGRRGYLVLLVIILLGVAFALVAFITIEFRAAPRALAPAPVLPRLSPNVGPQIAPPAYNAPSTSPLPYILIALVVGLGIGGFAVLGAMAWSRRRQSKGLSPVRAAPSPEPSAADAIAQVFVSYSRQDGQTVDRLVEQIKQLGYTVWIDRQSTGSQRYAAPIVHAIRTSRLVALMCSQHAFASDHVIREVYVAGDNKKPFIAFQLDRAEFPDEVQYFVSGFPRIPVAALDAEQLRSEMARLVTV